MRFEPWKCPKCDQQAKGTLERIPGLALVVFDEEGEAEYLGSTDVFWDDQITLEDEEGRVTLLCPAGHEWQAVVRDP